MTEKKQTTKYDRQDIFGRMKSGNRQQINHFLQMWAVSTTVSFTYVLARNPITQSPVGNDR